MFVRVGLLVCLMGLLTSHAWAEILSFDFRTSYYFPHSEEVKGDVDVKGAAGFGFAINYGYRDRTVELSVDLARLKLEGDQVDGDLLIVPIFISGYFRFHPFGRRWFPYIGAGVGVLSTGFDQDDKADFDINFGDSLALHGTLGFQVFVIQNWALNWYVRYLYAQPDIKLDGESEDFTDQLRLDGVVASFGVTKYF